MARGPPVADHCRRVSHLSFSVQKCARERPRYGASSAAVFYTTVKAALRHRSEDSEQHREGLGWDKLWDTNSLLWEKGHNYLFIS